MGLRVEFDSADIVAKLTAVGKDATNAAYGAIKEGGQEIRDQARAYAPVDEHDLEKAIVTQPVKDDLTVYIGIDPRATDERGVQIDFYGLMMHELLAPYGSGRFNLGPKSEAKGAGVGGKFLQRAFDELLKPIVTKTAFAVKRILRS